MKLAPMKLFHAFLFSYSMLISAAPDASEKIVSEIPQESIGYRGNWVKKRYWLNLATESNNKTKKVFDAIVQITPQFAQTSADTQKSLYSFWTELGLEKNKALSISDELVVDYTKIIQEKKLALKTDAQQNVQAYTLLDDEFIKIKKEIEELKKSFTLIAEFEKAIASRLDVVSQHGASAKQLASQAVELADQIWDIIDDAMAERNYNSIEYRILPHLNSILNYFRGEFASDFDATLKNAKMQLERAKLSIDDLEKKDLIIKNRAARLAAKKQVTAVPKQEAYTFWGRTKGWFNWLWGKLF